MEDWKSEIKNWCRDYNIPSPTFLLTRRELERILLRGGLKWKRFTDQYPNIFSSKPKETDIKDELKVIYAKLTYNEVFGEVAGNYTTMRVPEVTILVMNGKHKNNIISLRHEFFHHLAEEKEFFDDSDFITDEEFYAEKFAKTGMIDERFKDKLN